MAALTAVMIYSLNNFIGKLNKILSAENLSEQEKQATVKAISISAAIANLLSGYSSANGKEIASALFSIVAGGGGAIFEQVADLFDYARGLPDKPIVPSDI